MAAHKNINRIEADSHLGGNARIIEVFSLHKTTQKELREVLETVTQGQILAADERRVVTSEAKMELDRYRI
jgi:hypothetical protein